MKGFNGVNPTLTAQVLEIKKKVTSFVGSASLLVGMLSSVPLVQNVLYERSLNYVVRFRGNFPVHIFC